MQNVKIEIINEGGRNGAMAITIRPYKLKMPPSKNEEIKFVLVSKIYRFPEDANKAIKVHNNDGQFSGNTHGQGQDKGKVITISDKNTVRRVYKYSVVVEDGNGQQLVIDPLIENGPR